MAIALLASSRAAHAGDPYLEWFTLRTPHFRIHFHSGLDEIAQRIGGIAERAHQSVGPQLGWHTELTDIVISDDPRFSSRLRLNQLGDVLEFESKPAPAEGQFTMDIVRRLEDDGEIIISGRGGDDEIVV